MGSQGEEDGGQQLFLLSFRQRDELAAMVARSGRRAIAARRAEGVEQRFLASGAALAVVDARGALAEGLAAVTALGQAVEANAAALLVLVSRDDVAALDALLAAGATHFLASPFGEAEFVEALRYAERHAERLVGGHRVAATPVVLAGGEALTGLADGPAMRLWIEGRLRGESPRLVLLLIAINRFDMVNAAYGRVAGDALLRGVARRIERIVAAAGSGRRTVGRIAGAEFAVAIDAGTIGEAALIARDLVDDIGRSFDSAGQRVTLSARIGIAMAEGGDADTLLRRASAALAEARPGTAEAIRILDAAGEVEAMLASRLEVDLRRALDADEIEVRFQPQVSVTTGRIGGVEALARWRHPLLGELGAVTLFAAAKRSDFVSELSDHVRARALAEVAGWPGALAGLRVSLNVTAEDVDRTDFVERCLAMIEASGVARERVTLEVTESGLIENLGATAKLLARLRGSGLKIAIDDFGTGYSSLAYLNTLPLDYLKLDRRLSQDIAGSPRERVVVRGVIEMAHSLGLEVIAEGVENEAELALLAHEGVAYYQGYLCSEPLDSMALAARVASWPQPPL